MLKKIIFWIVIILILGAAWYLLSPLWNFETANDTSPLSQQTTEEEEEKVEEEEKTEASLVKEAPFIANAHEVEGKALIINNGDGTKTLRFENFDTVNGPDLFIYLSTDTDASDFVNLGRPKATRGNINYDIPSGTNLDKYNKVLVWCRAFSVLFSYADLSN